MYYHASITTQRGYARVIEQKIMRRLGKPGLGNSGTIANQIASISKGSPLWTIVAATDAQWLAMEALTGFYAEAVKGLRCPGAGRM